jgi:hypothetical protein
VDLMTATDKNGQSWSFLSSEAALSIYPGIARKNLIIPLVGDFAALLPLQVGEYLAAQFDGDGVHI